MDDGGWLSTRNRKKAQQPQPKLKKRRSSTLRPAKPGCLYNTSNSPPPKQLFTATQQSLLGDFFSTNRKEEDHLLDVEVIFDDSIQNGHPDNASISSMKKSEKLVECLNYNRECLNNNPVENSDGIVIISEEEDSHNYIESVKENIQPFCHNKLDRNTKGVSNRQSPMYSEITVPHSLENEYIEESEDSIEKTKLLHGTKIANDDAGFDLIEYSNMGNRKADKRKRYVSGSEYILEKLRKRKRTDSSLLEKKCDRTFEVVKETSIECTDLMSTSYEHNKLTLKRNMGNTQPVTENVENINRISQDIQIPMSCFNSQSLDLNGLSPASLEQQENGTIDALVLDFKKDNLSKPYESQSSLKLDQFTEYLNATTQEQHQCSDNLTFSSQSDDKYLLSDDMISSISSQTLRRNYEQLMSSQSLDLSSQKGTDDFELELTENSDLQEELTNESQFSLSLPRIQDYQSLQLE